MPYRRNYGRRRLGGNSYGRTMGFRPMHMLRKRKYPGAGTGIGAPPRLGRRVRPRMARSYTRTRTRTKKRLARVTGHGDNASHSVNSIGKRWLSRFDKVLARKVVAPQTVFANSTFSLNSSQGKQVTAYLPLLQKAVLIGMETASAGGATNVPTKFFLMGGKFSIKLRNQSNSNAKVMIYDIVTKRDTPDTNLDNPLSCWIKGLTDYGYASGHNTVGQTPYKSPEFNQYFGVNRVTVVSLEPGQQHDHHVYHRWNRIVDSIRFQNANGVSLAGLTRYVMVVAHGMLAHSNGDANAITYIPVTVDCAYDFSFKYGYIERTTRAYAITDNNPTNIGNLDFIGENQDIDADPLNT